MKEIIKNIFEVIDEYGSDLCDIDLLVRTERDRKFLSCEDCIFNGVDKEFGLGIAGCPYELVGKDNLLK